MTNYDRLNVTYETQRAPIEKVEVRMCGSRRHSTLSINKHGDVIITTGDSYNATADDFSIHAKMDRDQLRQFGQAMLSMASRA